MNILKVAFLHDNARPHASVQTQRKLFKLGWDILPYPPYSPDIALFDSNPFRSMENSLKILSFVNNEEVKNHLKSFFSIKPASFYKKGIMKLTERWNM